MACGTPVLASNSSSLPEVVGNAGVLLQPDDSAAWAGALRELTEHRAKREAMIAAGLVQAETFSWARAAERTLAVYRRALGHEEPASRPMWWNRASAIISASATPARNTPTPATTSAFAPSKSWPPARG